MPAPAGPLPAVRDAIPACKKIDPGPYATRRLTRVEYNNVVRDLLGLTGDLASPANDFPPEERRLGFDNNAEALSVSPLLAEHYMAAAEQVAAAAVDTQLVPKLLLGCDPAMQGEDACLNRFLTSFVKRAYRRPATADETQVLREAFALGKAESFKTGIKLALTVILQSPQFLYRIEVGQPPADPADAFVRLTSFEMASRLSFLLWNAPPDATLLTEAEQDRLQTPAQIQAQMGRMLVDVDRKGARVISARAKAMVAHFHEQWLDLEKLIDVEKDSDVFPAKVFPRSHLSLMSQELEKFLDEAYWGTNAGTLTSLLTGRFTYVDPTLFAFYALTGTAPTKAAMGVTPLQRVTLDGVKRGGVLTQGSVLVVQSSANQTSPVRRGKFVRERLLCQMLPPPPNDVMIELPQLSPTLTTRERFAQHSADARCAGCHQLMDPIGLGFESFDAIGRWRDKENGKPVDVSGEVVGLPDGKFIGVVGLEKKLAASDEAAACTTRQWFRYANGREEEAGADDCSLELAKRKFIAGGLKFRVLLGALTQSDAFMYKRAVASGGPP